MAASSDSDNISKPQEETSQELQEARKTDQVEASDKTDQNKTGVKDLIKSKKVIVILLIAFFMLFIMIAMACAVWFTIIKNDDKDSNNSEDEDTTESCVYEAELVQDIAIQAEEINPKDTFNKQWTIKNTGVCDWEEGEVELVFSSGDRINSDLVTSLSYVTIGEEITISLDLTAPEEVGTYKSIWKLKENYNSEFGDDLILNIEVKESDEEEPEVKPADLVITQLSTSTAEVRQGVPFKIIAKVKNQGGSNAVGFDAAWRACSGTNCAYVYFPNNVTLTPGEETTLQLDYTYSTWSTYTTDMIIDTTGKIAESNENNNIKTLVIAVKEGLPDLTIESVTYSPTTPIKGQPVMVQIAYKNNGTKPLAGTASLKWWSSVSAAQPACNILVGNIEVGQSKVATCAYVYPSWYSSITTKAVIDGDDEVKEADESNNSLEKVIKVNNQ